MLAVLQRRLRAVSFVILPIFGIVFGASAVAEAKPEPNARTAQPRTATSTPKRPLSHAVAKKAPRAAKTRPAAAKNAAPKPKAKTAKKSH